jgi:hypothetical protein
MAALSGDSPLLVSCTSSVIHVFASSLMVGPPLLEWVRSFDIFKCRSDVRGIGSNGVSLPSAGLQHLGSSVWNPATKWHGEPKDGMHTASLHEETLNYTHSSFLVGATSEIVYIWNILKTTPSDLEKATFVVQPLYEWHLPCSEHYETIHTDPILMSCFNYWSSVSLVDTPTVFFAVARSHSTCIHVCNLTTPKTDVTSLPVLHEDNLVHPCQVRSIEWKPCMPSQKSDILVPQILLQLYDHYYYVIKTLCIVFPGAAMHLAC